MKRVKLMTLISLLALVAMSFTTNAYSQRELAGDAGGNPPPPGEGMMAGPPPGGGALVMHAGDNGLFVLQGGTLTKYAAATLKAAGAVQLGEAEALPADAGNNARPMRPPVGGTFILTGTGENEMILAVCGNAFYRIDARTFTIAAKSTLPAPPEGQRMGGGPNRQGGQAGGGQGQPGAATNRPNGAPQGKEDGPDGQGGPGMQGGPDGQGGPGMRGGPGMQGGPGMRGGIVLEAHGTTLYVLRGPQLLAVNIGDGALIAQGTLATPQAAGQPR